MNQPNHNRIKQLIEDSGLIPFKKHIPKPYQKFDFSNEIILITGAAGSIGSELARHLLKCKFKQLILIDIAESPLYNLIKEFENEELSKIEFMLLNITEADSVEYLFEIYKPTLIFHTAAYKHVPLMEAHPYEAIKTNILGTKLLADLAIKNHVEKFIFISTDKAVNPINVMGISKCISENYLKQLNSKNNTHFIITRFGNIMGSNGSVLPLFIKQIESGLALTITNKTVSRYFIDKQEACNLILLIATFSKMESNVFTFNMGEPIKILDLANQLKSIYSEIDKKIAIKFIGLRQGEKMDEAIISNNETLLATENDAVFQVIKKSNEMYKNLDYSALLNITPYKSPAEIKKLLLDSI